MFHLSNGQRDAVWPIIYVCMYCMYVQYSLLPIQLFSKHNCVLFLSKPQSDKDILYMSREVLLICMYCTSFVHM